MSGGPTAGEITGIIAALAGALFGMGRGVQWLFSWGERRAESRAAKLQLWHEELSAREATFDARVEDRLKTLEGKDRLREAENMALRMAFELVASALRAIDPRNTALSRAEQLLQVAFPLAPIVPPDMTTSLQTIHMEVQG
ncbi:MAG TPA: hypothetical protein QF469_02590 [Sphingomonas sanguinis]|uniref:hypothetical protein n=1 Tax=Sphingomonas sanguinis TaxID=33051 RepID=UPI002ABF8952|nr:hypothetical protein [Sphingomonas sanguinis]